MKLHIQALVAIGLGIKRNWHIFLAIILGILFGAFLHKYSLNDGAMNSKIYHYTIVTLNMLGQMFIRLIQMLVIPLVVSAIVVGISSVGDSKQIGKFGKNMILYYSIIILCAVGVGGLLAVIVQPGNGVQTFISQTTAAEVQQQAHNAIAYQQSHLSSMILDLIPRNPIESIADGDMIPIIFFVLVFAFAIAKVGEIARPVVSFFESIFAATMKVTDWIMVFAAPGIFALTAYAVATFGINIFSGISKFIAVLLAGFLFQYIVVYPLMLKFFSKVPVTTLYTAITEALMVAFGTASSSATLPLTIACCEKRGISHKVCGFVLPLGATLNMDGTALFQTVAVIFLTQAYGVTLEPIQIISVMFLAIIASSTSAGIPGAGLITIALVLNGLGLTPQQLVEGFAFLFAIERIMDMLRTTLNVASDAVVAAIIADNENEINYDLFNNPDAYKDII